MTTVYMAGKRIIHRSLTECIEWLEKARRSIDLSDETRPPNYELIDSYVASVQDSLSGWQNPDQ